MKLKLTLISIGLVLVLGGAAVAPHKASAQDNSAETGKRKVRARVTPEYPPLAKQMNMTGKVKLEATVAADGHVVSTRVLGGSPVLVSSAIEALKKWRFEPAAKETTEVVEFQFDGQTQQ